VFEQAMVALDGAEVPPPAAEPKLWALFKPRKVLCEAIQEKSDGTETLRRRMRRWYEKEMVQIGKTVGVGLEEESLKDKHWVIVTGLSWASDGLVLLTNDGIFAQTLASAESNILSAFDVKIQGVSPEAERGDPPVDLLHKWRTGAKAGGVKYGRVWCSMTKRTGATSRLRVKYVESPERPIDMLLDAHGMRVQTIRRYAFGPYLVTDVPQDRVLRIPIHKSLRHLIPVADMRQALVPVRGALIE
ncbi:unnamed protein product, partial [Symbiodinium pilosum]